MLRPWIVRFYLLSLLPALALGLGLLWVLAGLSWGTAGYLLDRNPEPSED